jgi:hypothetical protein
MFRQCTLLACVSTGKVGSLVNPQLDAFRKIMFSPALYTLWERLMVRTGLENNQLLPAVLVALISTLLVPATVLFITADDVAWGWQEAAAALALLPLAVALWGAYLFQPGSSGRGYASATRNEKRE